MPKENETQNWFDSVNPESVEKGLAILPTFAMPNENETKTFTIRNNPYVIPTPNSPHNDSMVKMGVKFGDSDGEIILPNSLINNLAVEMKRRNMDYSESLEGMTLEVSKVKGKDGYFYYHCNLIA